MKMMMATFRVCAAVLLGGALTACGTPSPAAARAAGAQLKANYDAEVRPLALRGIDAQEADGTIGPGTADVLRRTLDKHGQLIEQLANPK